MPRRKQPYWPDDLKAWGPKNLGAPLPDPRIAELEARCERLRAVAREAYKEWEAQGKASDLGDALDALQPGDLGGEVPDGH